MNTRPLSPNTVPDGRHVITRSARMMGTEVSVHLAVERAQAPRAQASATQCLDWLAEVDARLSRFHPESELCQLNRAGGRWFSASALLVTVIARALQGATESDGLFDPTLLPQLERLGYDRDFAQIAHQAIPPVATGDAAPTEALGGWREIELDLRRRRIRLPPGVRLDLGGIAKGWAADVALERFCEGCAGALINVGGDLRLRGGPQPGAAWSVGIRHPRAGVDTDTPEHIATITLSRGGLATSGAQRRWWWRNGQRQHHLLDPRTGAPAPLWIADDVEASPSHDAHQLAIVTALAPTAAEAEVATKIALLRGSARALQAAPPLAAAKSAARWELSADGPLALLFTFGSGELQLSPNMDAYLTTWGTEGAPLPFTLQPTSTSFPRRTI